MLRAEDYGPIATRNQERRTCGKPQQARPRVPQPQATSSRTLRASVGTSGRRTARQRRPRPTASPSPSSTPSSRLREPRTVAAVQREHLEAFIEDRLARLRPATAANRYRSLRQYFRYLVDAGELQESPMAKMRPPRSPRSRPLSSPTSSSTTMEGHRRHDVRRSPTPRDPAASPRHRHPTGGDRAPAHPGHRPGPGRRRGARAPAVRNVAPGIIGRLASVP